MTPAPPPARFVPTPRELARIKLALFVLCLLPALGYGWAFASDRLGANPIEAITRASGEWTLRLLLLTLAVTPLRRFTGWHWLLRLRRMLGLFVFAYACLHALSWLWLDQFFDWRSIVNEIRERPFITVGVTAFVLLIPLAATSSHAAIRALGGRRWQNLHRTIYAIALLAIVHYWWVTRADMLKPLLYAIVLALLLGARAQWRQREMDRQLAANAPAARFKTLNAIPIVPQASGTKRSDDDGNA